MGLTSTPYRWSRLLLAITQSGIEPPLNWGYPTVMGDAALFLGPSSVNDSRARTETSDRQFGFIGRSSEASEAKRFQPSEHDPIYFQENVGHLYRRSMLSRLAKKNTTRLHFRVNCRYLIRCGRSAAAPSRILRSASYSE